MTAYEMRIIDWSSDVCSSDLPSSAGAPAPCRQAGGGVQARFRPRRAIAVKAAMGAARPQQEPAMTHESLPFLSPDTESSDEPHALPPTAHLLDELAPYGPRPGRAEPDPPPLPESGKARGGK